jgi:hypothetical protein
LRFSFMPFWMDLCFQMSHVATGNLSFIIELQGSKYLPNLDFGNVSQCSSRPLFLASSFASVCLGCQFGQTSFQVLLAVPIGKRHQKTIHMLQMLHICYIQYICFNSLGISLVSFVFGQRKGNVLH